MKQINSLKKLTRNDYNTFALLRRKISKDLNKSIATTNIIMYEYIRFMQMAAEHEGMIPSKIVDIVWHHHIQFTKDYAGFCDFITEDTEKGSRFIQHDPSDPRIPTKHDETNNNYQNTLNWYFTMFGEEPRADVWLYSNKSEWIKYKVRSKPTYKMMTPTYNSDGMDIGDILTTGFLIDAVLPDSNNDSFQEEQSYESTESTEYVEPVQESSSSCSSTSSSSSSCSSTSSSSSSCSSTSSSSSSCSSSD